MTHSIRLTLAVSTGLLMALGSSTGLSAIAQPIIAAPDGTGTHIHSNGSEFQIQGGTPAGSNLFHSFQQFNLNAQQTATFLATPGIQNILSRVVGGSPSYIDGLIRVTGSPANLYLMNPSGIVFGANASLNVPAAFTATTANAIGLGCTAGACDQWFTAVGAPPPANLTGQPGGLAFLTAAPGAIVNAGTLAVPAGQTLTLAGGTVINTGTLTAPGGTVSVLAVPGDRFVRIQPSGQLLSWELPLATQRSLLEFAPPLAVPALPELLTGGSLASATGVTVTDGVVRLTQTQTPIAQTPGTLALAGHISVDAGTAIGNAGTAIATGEHTQFLGSISAQGGVLGGNGGFVETSGRQTLAIAPTAQVITHAPQGTWGTWLLDPLTLTVVATGGTGAIVSGTNAEPDSTINASTVVTALNGSNVILQADVSITIDALLDASGNALLGNLTLQAPTIVLNQAITLKSGATLTGTANRVSVGAAGSIQNAVDVAANQATVFLAGSTYTVADPVRIDRSVTVQGAGAGNTQINGGGTTRLFQIDAGTVTLANLSLINGRATSGGAITNAGTLTLQNTVLAQNIATSGDGGAIYNTGTLTVQDSNLTNNWAGDEGGAIFNGGLATIRNSTLAQNTAANRGGAIHNVGILKVDASTVTGNVAANEGGALLNWGGIAAIESSTITQNRPTNAQGSIVNYGFLQLVNSVVDAPPVVLPSPPPLPSLPLPPPLPSPVPVLPPLPPLLNIPTVLSRPREPVEVLRDPQRATAIAQETAPILTTRTNNTPAQAIALTDRTFSQAYTQHLGLSEQVNVSMTHLQTVLSQLRGRGIQSAIIYVSFVPSAETSAASSRSPQPDDQLQLTLVRATGEPLVRTLPVTRAEVVTQAKLFRVAVADPDDDASYIPLARQLYGWLLAPLEATLQADGISHLVFCLDEGLRVIPLAAMLNQDQFVAERYAVSIIPSAALTDLTVTPPQIQRLVAMGADRFQQKEALPAVPLELSLVQRQVPQSATVLLNEQFTLSNLTQAQRDRPEILHLATHAELSPGSAEQSYIQLWDSRLTLPQMRSLNWRDMNLTLLTLSACTTAVSSREAELGFAGLAAVSGVRSVLGSLWTVSDIGTLALMNEFYSNLQQSATLAGALQAAQLRLLKGQVWIERDRLVSDRGSVTLPSDPARSGKLRLRHPFYWSSFMLIGNPW